MQDTKIYPAQAVEMRVKLSGLYSFYSQSLEDILMRKPNTWIKIREKHKSDKQTDLEYSTTPDGQNEIGLTMRLKRIEKMLSSLRSIIETANTEYNYAKH
jgi:hypothetical protein